MSALFDTTPFETQRQHMIDSQLLTNRILDKDIITAFQTTPRELFVPKEAKKHAYTDTKITLSTTRTLLEPMVLGKLLQAAQPKQDDITLIIGCGTGYSTALLSQLSSTVFAVEEEAEFSKQARKNLSELQILNAEIITGKLSAGYEKQKPYSLILIDGAIESIPKKIIDQLDKNGRLITMIKENDFITKGILAIKNKNKLTTKTLFETNTPLLKNFETTSSFTL